MNKKEKEGLRLKKKRRNQIFGVGAIFTMTIPMLLSVVMSVQNSLAPTQTLSQEEMMQPEEEPVDSVVRLKEGEPGEPESEEIEMAEADEEETPEETEDTTKIESDETTGEEGS